MSNKSKPQAKSKPSDVLKSSGRGKPRTKPAAGTGGRASFAFPKDAVEFLRDLKANNNREWFGNNKARYELSIKQPASDFCELMTAELAALTGMPHASKIFRVNRDIRFSKDKTPYKAYLHILFRQADVDGAPNWFFGLEPDKLVLGAGIFSFEKEALDAFRRRVASGDGARLDAVLGRLRRSGVRIRDPELKRVPSGYSSNTAHPDLLRHKGLTAWLDHPGGPAAAAKGDIVASTIKSLKSLKPLIDWLNER